MDPNSGFIIETFDESAIVGDLPRGSTSPTAQADIEHITGPGIDPDESSPHLLLADDSPHAMFVVNLILIQSGYWVECAENGKIALDKYIEAVTSGQPFDAVLCDIEMPVMNGYEAISKIREYEKDNGLPKTPIIALTAHDEAHEVNKCHTVGCNTVLTKPVQEHKLIELVSEFVPLPDDESDDDEIPEAPGVGEGGGGGGGMGGIGLIGEAFARLEEVTNKQNPPAERNGSSKEGAQGAESEGFDMVGLIKDFREKYLVALKLDLTRAEEYLQNSDWENIRRLGHTMQGTVGHLGYDGVSAASKRMKAAAVDHDADGVRTALDELKDLTRQTELVEGASETMVDDGIGLGIVSGEAIMEKRTPLNTTDAPPNLSRILGPVRGDGNMGSTDDAASLSMFESGVISAMRDRFFDDLRGDLEIIKRAADTGDWETITQKCRAMQGLAHDRTVSEGINNYAQALKMAAATHDKLLVNSTVEDLRKFVASESQPQFPTTTSTGNGAGQGTEESPFSRDAVISLMRTSYLHDLKNNIDSIEDAVKEKRFDDVYKAAHKMHGSGGQLDIPQVVGIAHRIKSFATDKNDAGVRGALDSLREYLRELKILEVVE